MLEWNTKYFPLSFHSDLILSNFRDAGVGFELRNQLRHCKTVCIKRNLYLINYNRMRTQWTAKGNRDAGSSCLCDRGLHRYFQNFGGGFEHPKPPLGTPLFCMLIPSHKSPVVRDSAAQTADDKPNSAGPGYRSSARLPLRGGGIATPWAHLSGWVRERMLQICVFLFLHSVMTGSLKKKTYNKSVSVHFLI